MKLRNQQILARKLMPLRQGDRSLGLEVLAAAEVTCLVVARSVDSDNPHKFVRSL